MDDEDRDFVSDLNKRVCFQQTDLSVATKDILLAVQLRIGVKRCLEEALKAVMGRSKGGLGAVIGYGWKVILKSACLTEVSSNLVLQQY